MRILPLLLVLGCEDLSADTTVVKTTPDPADVVLDTPRDEVQPVPALPSSLTCVSAASPGAYGVEVTRLWIATDGTKGTVTSQRGPQFWSHGGQWSGTTAEAEHRDV